MPPSPDSRIQPINRDNLISIIVERCPELADAPKRDAIIVAMHAIHQTVTAISDILCIDKKQVIDTVERYGYLVENIDERTRYKAFCYLSAYTTAAALAIALDYKRLREMTPSTAMALAKTGQDLTHRLYELLETMGDEVPVAKKENFIDFGKSLEK